MSTSKSIKIIFRYEFLLTAFILFVLLSFSCSSKNQFACEEIINPSYPEEIEKIEAFLDEKKFDGAVLISKNKDIILAKGYGPCDRKNPEAGDIQINTSFEIGSITKQMTAAAIMQLVEKKKLKVDDKISRWFPDFQYADDITVEMLLAIRITCPGYDPRQVLLSDRKDPCARM